MKTIFFDFDGLIVDTESAYRRAWATVLKPSGLENFDEMASGKREEDAARLLKPYFRDEITSESVALDLKRSTFVRLMEDLEYLRTLPGIRDLVVSLWGKHRMHIVSNSTLRFVEGPLRLLAIRDFFDCLVCWTPGSKAKPYPDPYLLALKKTQVAARDAIALEDSTTGLEAAIAAGITPVCIGTNQPALRYCDDRGIAHYESAALLVGIDPEEWTNHKSLLS